MANKKKAKESGVILTADEELEAAMAPMKLGDSLCLVDDYSDIDVVCVSSGFPGLDACFGPTHFGIPKGQQSEFFSKKEHSGKSTSALQIGQYWQSIGLRVGIVDLEKSTTKEYYKTLGFYLTPAECPPGVSALRIMRPTFDIEGNKKQDITLENVLDTVRNAANVFDLLIVDSVDALVTEAEGEKSSAEPGRVGGIGGQLRRFMRNTTNKRAHILWVNHADVSTNSKPGVPASYATRGGKSIPRYSFLRVELTVIEKLRVNKDADPYGFVTRFQVVKNKMGDNWRYTDIPYIYGEGFSRKYDYFNRAVKLGIITKAGAGWYAYVFREVLLPAKEVYKDSPEVINEMGFDPEEMIDVTPDPIKVQGELNMYNKIKEDNKFFEAVKEEVDNSNIKTEVLPEEQRGDEEEALGVGEDSE